MMTNDIEVNGTTQKQYAQMAGVSEPTITRFMNQKAILGFDSILSIVKHKFPDREEQLMTNYILSQDNQNARLALEYCMMNQMPEIADQLIDKLKNSEYSANKEWARVYEIEGMRIKKEISPHELIGMAHKIEAKSEEMKILAKLLDLYANYDLANYPYLQGLIIGLEQYIDDIKSGFMKRSFKLRLGQALSYIALFNNEVDSCRYYANMVIENTDNPYFIATAYHILGNSYLYETFEESLFFLNKALNYYDLSNREQYKKVVIRNMNFVKCFWNKEVNTCSRGHQNSNEMKELEFDDICEIAFYEIRNENTYKAKEILATFDLLEMADRKKGFYYYYMALASGDNIDLFYDSVRYFQKSGDKYYIKLPLKELKRLGERESILSVFIA